jgi:hypothetical protein
MLQRNSTKVETCLASAARSRERATDTADPATKDFFMKMETSWMRLAASIAHSERVDLLLHGWQVNGFGSDHCLRCQGPTRLKLIEVSESGGERHTFECLQCGLDQVHDRIH